MRLRFTLPAARQLDRALDRIAEESPRGARRVQERIRAVLAVLSDQPLAGRRTSRPGMRRIVAIPYPYAIFYRVEEGEIVVHGVRHTARRPPHELLGP